MSVPDPWRVVTALSEQGIMKLAVIADVDKDGSPVYHAAVMLGRERTNVIEGTYFDLEHPWVQCKSLCPSSQWYARSDYEIISTGKSPNSVLSNAIRRLRKSHDDVDLIIKFLGAKQPIVDPELRKAIIARDGGKCVYCGRKAILADHLHPRATGGIDAKNNLVAACWRCNSTKSDAAWLLWYRAQRFYAVEREAYIEGIIKGA